jgi:UDP-N-acetylglucosamine 4,6-dehydratase
MRINEKTSILVTGGTGSFGKKFVEAILQKFPNIHRLNILDYAILLVILEMQEG